MNYHDDPRFTAYALGELQDEAERAEIEALIENSVEARDLVDAIRSTARLVQEELGMEPVPGLTDAQRERILVDGRAERNRGWRRILLWSGAAAAGALLGLSLALMWRDAPTPPRVSSFVRKTIPPVAKAPASPAPPVQAPPPPPALPSAPAGSEPMDDLERLSTTNYEMANALRRTTRARQDLAPETLQQLESLGYVSGTAGGVEFGVPGGVIGGPRAVVAESPRVLAYRGIDTLRSHNTEAYARVDDNDFKAVDQNPLSTFSVDVDTASYANLRRFISRSTLPPKDAVRIEEMINYFDYDYPSPTSSQPFSVNVEMADAPWRPEHRLMRIGLKGTPLQLEERPPLNLVFLLDVSGSMSTEHKLPLLKSGMRMLVGELTENDHVAIVVYAGASGLALPRTSGDQKRTILDALDRLQSGGSTNGGAGIQLAYDQALAHFIPEGTNRVVLATDGDFNVGVTSQGDLTRLIEERAAEGVFLSVLGFGMGNYKDSTLEQLADRGNGNYAYIDSISEARKVLVREMVSTLVTIAKDVKIQVEFNPAMVDSYRLIGYENRVLQAEDFNDDRKDAGEIGAGHTVTALYEIVPVGSQSSSRTVDPLKYQPERAAPENVSASSELLTVKLRYKEPDGDTSRLLEYPVESSEGSFASATEDFKLASAVAAFGMILRDSPHKGTATVDGAVELAQEGLGLDRHGYRAELVELMKRAKQLLPR